MGHSITPAYRIEIKATTGGLNAAWQTRRPKGIPKATGEGFQGYGRPTEENLQAFCRHFEKSTHVGGVNEHIGLTFITSAQIVKQATDEVVATYSNIIFQAV